MTTPLPDHLYRWKTARCPFMGQKCGSHPFYRRACRVVARGRMNSVLVEFENGEKAVVSRYAVRRAA